MFSRRTLRFFSFLLGVGSLLAGAVRLHVDDTRLATGGTGVAPDATGADFSVKWPFKYAQMLGEPEIQKRLHWQCPSARFFGGYFTDESRGKLPIGDGGRWVCNPEAIKLAAEAGDCLIYSIGSDGEFSFERAVHDEISDKCEFHTFDANPIEYYTDGKYNPGYPHTINPNFVNYHVERLGPKNNLADLIKKNGHQNRTINILKTDCEGCEWDTYEQWLDAPANFAQILVEVHGRDHAPFSRHFINHGYALFHDNSGGSTPELAYLKI